MLPSLLGQNPEAPKPPVPKRIVPVGPDPAAVPVAPQAVGPGRRLALVIGNNAYRKAPALHNAANDAQDLGDQLGKLDFEVARSLDSGVAATRSAVDGFTSRLKPGDIALFFYSGHGIQARGENYIVPVDFDPAGGEAKLDAGCLRASAARDAMEKSGAGLNIVILDACRDNPFRPGEKVKGMALMEPGLGTCIALATGPGRTASDNSGERNGLFTKHLLKEIVRPGQSIEAMFKKVKDNVYTDSAGAQRPWTFSDIVGEFFFGAAPAGFNAQSRAAEYLASGHRQFQAGQFEDAAASFDRAVRVDPENPFAYNALGAARAKLKQWSVAVGLFAQAIDKKEDYAAAYFNRGVAYYNAARYPLALQDFDWAVQQEPGDPRALDLRGRTHLALRDTEPALADFNGALELDPSDSAALAGRGSVYFRMGRYPDAVRELTASLSLKPAAEAFDARAQVYRALHQTAQADADDRQSQALRAHP